MIALSALAVAVLFGTGVALMARRDIFHLAAGTQLVSNAAILFLVAGGFGDYQAPILPIDDAHDVSDPLLQALALTAVVISFGTTVLLLRLALAVETTDHTTRVEDLVRAEVEEGEDRAPAERER